VAHGVEPERMRVAAHVETEPVEESAETEEAHEQNRRVVFRVIEAVEQNAPAESSAPTEPSAPVEPNAPVEPSAPSAPVEPNEEVAQ
jgi:hypothetical protein